MEQQNPNALFSSPFERYSSYIFSLRSLIISVLLRSAMLYFVPLYA